MRARFWIVPLLLIGITRCGDLTQCEFDAHQTGAIMTRAWNPDGIVDNAMFGLKVNFGDTCHVFATGTFTPVEGAEGFYRYALPTGMHLRTGGQTCHAGTLVRLSPETRRPYYEEAQAKLQTCKTLQGAQTH